MFRDARARLDRLPLRIYQYRIVRLGSNANGRLKTRIGNRTEVLNTELLLQDRKSNNQTSNADLLIKDRKKNQGSRHRFIYTG